MSAAARAVACAQALSLPRQHSRGARDNFNSTLRAPRVSVGSRQLPWPVKPRVDTRGSELRWGWLSALWRLPLYGPDAAPMPRGSALRLSQ